MSFLYNLSIYVYYGLILAYSPFKKKARLWVNGRKNLFSRIRKDLSETEKIVWFHAASLGEFEQGRPVIEGYKKKYPDHKILLTFFSPSGYEIRKNYPEADFIYYLPIDTPKNARKFINVVKPEKVVFIKYEFWFNYLKILKKENIPVYIVSAIFRQDQHFFKWYGSWFRKQLKNIMWFFVQNEDSKGLLNSIGITNVTVSGDTRFDRVNKIASQKKNFPFIEKFASGHKVLLAGSSWPSDEKLLVNFSNRNPENLKIIIAPHEIHKERIQNIQTEFSRFNPILFSEANEQNIISSTILIIDGMGFLSSLYQYCDIAFIGGGFGKGIHNILEAVTFGKPVLFGPNYNKFSEAVNLIQKGGAFSVDENSFVSTVNKLFLDKGFYQQTSDVCRKFIAENTGSTEIILNNI